MAPRRARRRPGENRAQLLEAGLIEFGLFGYHGASTASIAARAGVPQPHLYANFSGKQELFLACLSEASAALLGAGGASDGSRPGLMVLQAVAAARDEPLRGALNDELVHLRTRIGEAAFDRILAAAAAAQLGVPSGDQAGGQPE